MGLEVEEMVAQAMRGLTERSLADLLAIPERDHTVDDLEKQIHERCMTILVRHQLAATDLRFLVSIIRLIGELERVGDSTKNIAASAQELIKEARLKPYIDLPHMARIAGEMVHASLDSFLNRDAEKARAVCLRDNELDELYQRLEALLAEGKRPTTDGAGNNDNPPGVLQ